MRPANHLRSAPSWPARAAHVALIVEQPHELGHRLAFFRRLQAESWRIGFLVQRPSHAAAAIRLTSGSRWYAARKSDVETGLGSQVDGRLRRFDDQRSVGRNEQTFQRGEILDLVLQGDCSHRFAARRCRGRKDCSSEDQRLEASVAAEVGARSAAYVGRGMGGGDDRKVGGLWPTIALDQQQGIVPYKRVGLGLDEILQAGKSRLGQRMAVVLRAAARSGAAIVDRAGIEAIDDGQ